MGFFKDEKKKIEPEPTPKVERTYPAAPEIVNKSVIGKSVKIKGDIIAEEEMFIEGSIEGVVQCSKLVVIGDKGNVKADLHAPIIRIAGKVKGNIFANTKVEVESTANIEGNITAPKLSVSESAYFKGNIDMSSKPDMSPKLEKRSQQSEEPAKSEELQKKEELSKDEASPKKDEAPKNEEQQKKEEQKKENHKKTTK